MDLICTQNFLEDWLSFKDQWQDIAMVVVQVVVLVIARKLKATLYSIV